MSPKNTTCSRCGSRRIVPGKFFGDGAVAFKPSKIKKLFSITGSVQVAAIACLDCGTVDLSIDPLKLHELAGEPDAGGARPK
jgi:hypothetical protein